MSAQPDLAAGRPAGARWRTLRWLVPVAALCAAALLVDGILSADAKPTLPSRSPAQLLASVSATEPPASPAPWWPGSHWACRNSA
jgi:hypothetical protein